MTRLGWGTLSRQAYGRRTRQGLNYNSGATELLAYIFKQETGQDIDDYGQKYLFAPLGIRHEWKRTYLQGRGHRRWLVSEWQRPGEDRLLVSGDGVWDGKRIVSSEWVKRKSVTPYFQTDAEEQFKDMADSCTA